jgi:SAM-dependent methyltransferase
VDQYDPAMSFDERAASSYDNTARGDEEECVAFLANLAGEGPALELAIGTGRIGLPLAATGLRVDGIDISEPMVEQLRQKPGGADLQVTIGDFAAVPLEGSYRLIYVVFNTLFNLITQDDQVRCFRNVAEHLTDDGVFVVEAFEPGYLIRWPDFEHTKAADVGTERVHLDVARVDPVAQLLEKTHVYLTEQGTRLNPVVLRYSWPSELDLMARMAGLRLHQRWSGWRGEPFTGASRMHVSVWGR